MKVQVIVGSTRPNRVTMRAAQWVANEAANLPETDVEVVDLADYPMPFLDEAISPQFNPNRQPDKFVNRWLHKVAKADAYILVTPEYNRSYPVVLKNALDFIDYQMEKKPVAFVAHGSTGGAQAIAHLRGVLPGLLAITVPRATFLTGRIPEMIDEHGNLNEELQAKPHGPHTMLKAMLSDLKWYSDTLSLTSPRAVPALV